MFLILHRLDAKKCLLAWGAPQLACIRACLRGTGAEQGTQMGDYVPSDVLGMLQLTLSPLCPERSVPRILYDSHNDSCSFDEIPVVATSDCCPFPQGNQKPSEAY